MKMLRSILLVVITLVLTSCGEVKTQNVSGPKAQSPNNVPPASAPKQEALLIHLKLSDGKFGTKSEGDALFALERELEADIAKVKGGDFDGNEFGEGECVFFIYGPDADKLFSSVEARLKSSPLSKGGWAIKRYGRATDANVKETRIDL
jgi:hypothetical protein